MAVAVDISAVQRGGRSNREKDVRFISAKSTHLATASPAWMSLQPASQREHLFPQRQKKFLAGRSVGRSVGDSAPSFALFARSRRDEQA